MYLDHRKIWCSIQRPPINECSYNSGGYFFINGSEKVLIAQEGMATNHVYAFAKAQPSPKNVLAEIGSAVTIEKGAGGKAVSQFQAEMFQGIRNVL